MKTSRRMIKVFFSLIAVIAIALCVAITAFAAETVNVTNWNELSAALSAPGEANVVVKKAISEESKSDFETVIIKDKKTLDLAGQTIIYTYKNSDGDEKFVNSSNHSIMFSVPSGAELTVKDTSAEKLGMIFFDAHTPSVYDFNMSAIRDIFHVYGKLTVEDGIINAGREKEQYVFALKIGSGRLYSGDVYQQVYGTPVTLHDSGEFIANGGMFFGRGGALTYSKTLGGDYRGSVIRIDSGYAKAIINDGEFQGVGGANVINTTFDNVLTINNGYFETKGRSAALINYNGYVVADCEKGSLVSRNNMWQKNLGAKLVRIDDEIYVGEAVLSNLNLITGVSNAHICTILDFETQTPAMPEGRTTTGLGMISKGFSKEIYFKEKVLPTALKELGYTVYSIMKINNEDTGDTFKYYTSQQEKKFNCNELPVGNYSIVESIIMSKGSKMISRIDHTFLVEIFNNCEHTFSESSNTATCIEAGVKTENCTKCGEKRTVASAALGHTFEDSNDWSYNGEEHWYYCYRCDSAFSTGTHTFDQSGVCTVCDFNNNCSHDEAMDTDFDENYHWWPCDHRENCPGNGQLEKERHYIRKISDGGYSGSEPTTEYNCQMGYTCGGCGEYFGEKFNHKWVLDLERSYASTTTENGLNMYVCAYDGGTDIKGNTISCSAEKKIVLPKHRCMYDFDNPVNNTATCTNDGYQTILCKICNQGIYVDTYALGHDFEFVKGTATCTEGGTIDRYECTRCKKMSTDPEGENIITGYVSDYPLDHKMNWNASVPATCATYAKNAHYKCEYCQETFLDESGKTKITVEDVASGYAEHNLTFIAGTAGCDNVGFLSHYSCKACHKIFLDEEGKNEVSDEDILNKTIPHNITWTDAKPADCTAAGQKYPYGTCNGCRRLFVKNTDNGDAIENYNASLHSIPKLGHDFSKQVIDDAHLLSAATKESPAIYYYGCSRCYAISPDRTFTYGEKLSGLGKCEYVYNVVSSNAVKLTWSAVEGADGYRVFRQVSGSWVKLGTTTKTEGIIKNLQSGTTYTFAILAGAVEGDEVVWAKDYTTVTVVTKFTRPEQLIAQQNNVAIKLIWSKVDAADGYAVYQKNDNGSWVQLGLTTKTNAIINNLTPGKVYTFAVRAVAKSGDKIVYAKDYTTIETATKPLAPAKIVADQNENAILLKWSAVSGATHYRVLVKNTGGWEVLGHVTKPTAILKNLTPGTRYTYGIIPLVLTDSGVITGNYITYVAATAPEAPVTTAVSSSQGKLSISWSAVEGAEAYQLYFKEGNGNYKLYKNYATNGALSFSGLKSGTVYTFAVRAAKRTTGGWIFGTFNPITVTVK